ncbi:MAG TPA: hypothetical protein VKB67_11720 [Rhizomicrobium sp.]|nr:hypothetical protein [Rhizomicrobium sp.]
MAHESQLEQYLRKAKEADREQARAKDPQVQLAWDRIAVGYWQLAEYIAKRDSISLSLFRRAASL